MKPARFDYYTPRSLSEAIELLGRHGDEAKLLAGGQSLVPMMNLRLAQPAILIDLNHVEGLAYIRPDHDRVAIGAMTRHHEVAGSDVLRERCGLLSTAAGLIGYPAIRHRGTLGGSLAHADPVSEMPCVAMTLDAELVAVGPAGERVIGAGEFFQTYFTTALAPDEVLREVRVPVLGAGDGWGFHESARKTGDFATVAVAVHLRVTGDAVVTTRIGIAGVADRPVRAGAAESAMSSGDDVNLEEVAGQAVATVEEVSDIHASAEYRRRVVPVLVRRALDDALAMARGGRA